MPNYQRALFTLEPLDMNILAELARRHQLSRSAMIRQMIRLHAGWEGIDTTGGTVYTTDDAMASSNTEGSLS